MALHPLRMTPRIPLSGAKCKKPSAAARTDSAAPRALTTSTTGLLVARAAS